MKSINGLRGSRGEKIERYKMKKKGKEEEMKSCVQEEE